MPEALAVSVIIPTYNRAELLRAALQSVLDQTMPAREIVVVDDGSTDSTPELIGELRSRGAPITYLTGPHTNRRGEARNRGVGATASPLVAFLDSDDLWKPDRLQRQVEALERTREAGFAFCNVHRFDERGLLGDEPCLRPSADYNGSILSELLEEPLAVSSTLLIRRELFDAVGGFADLRMNEDYDLTLRLAARSPASYVPEVLVLMREHASRTSRSDLQMPLLDYISIVKRFLASQPGVPASARVHARRGLANVHFKLARLFEEQGDWAGARKHIWAALRLRPWDRRTLLAGLRALSSPRSGQARA